MVLAGTHSARNRFKIRRALYATAAAALCMLSWMGPVPAQTVNLRSELCRPIVVGPDDLVNVNHIPIADDAFLRGSYRLAFHVYYQYFFCFNGDGLSYNPAADDSGAAQLLRDALSAAYDGNYSKALVLAKRSYAEDPRFGEALLIVGELQWIVGSRRDSLSTLSVTQGAVGYPMPPDHEQPALPYVHSATYVAAALERRVR